MIKRFCDRCKKEVDTGCYYTGVELVSNFNLDAFHFKGFKLESKITCNDCYTIISNLFRKWESGDS